jgi:glyoxylase-like metal-dependent hydrolase (beta-lactamase superfamily II)
LDPTARLVKLESMRVERFMSPGWLSNTWLVADRPGGTGVLIDAGGPFEPVAARIAELGLEVTHLLLTHHHVDHVAHAQACGQRFGCALCGGAPEGELFAGAGLALERPLADGDEFETGGLRIRALWTPGHTRGQFAYLLNDAHVFTGDTLFRGSVGGTRAAGHGRFEELRESLLGTLLALPPETEVHPGHMESTTIGREAEHNPFLRAFRGEGLPAERQVRAYGRPASVLLEAPDYDGGTKAWVRFLDDGELAVVPGSRLV